MSKAIYCDHCEKLSMAEHIKSVKITPFYNEELELDLCKECHDQLEAWAIGKFNVEIPEEDDGDN